MNFLSRISITKVSTYVHFCYCAEIELLEAPVRKGSQDPSFPLSGFTLPKLEVRTSSCKTGCSKA